MRIYESLFFWWLMGCFVILVAFVLYQAGMGIKYLAVWIKKGIKKKLYFW